MIIARLCRHMIICIELKLATKFNVKVESEVKHDSLHFRIPRRKICHNSLCKVFLEPVITNVYCCFDTYFWLF